MSVSVQKQAHPLVHERHYQNTINVLITKKCPCVVSGESRRLPLCLLSISAKVLFYRTYSTVSHPRPPCPPRPPPSTPISNNSSQTLTRNPFPHKPMKTSKSRHTSAAGPFKGTFAPLCFSFSVLSFPPHLFFFSSTRCNCSDFLLFSLTPSSPYVSPRRYFLDFLTVSLLISPLALFDPTSPARPCPSPLSLLTL